MQRAAERRRQRRLFLERLEERAVLATMTWDGSSSALWSDAANWVGDIAPAAGDELFFPAGAANLTNTNDLAAGTTFNTVLFTGSGYNISGNAITLTGGLTANNVTGNNTFTPAITIQNGLTIMSANPGTTLTMGAIDTAYLVGATSLLGSSALTFDGAGTTAVNGVISGNGSINKLGGGLTILSGNNTYTGLTDVRQGYLRAASATALGSATSGDTQIQAGAQLQVAGTFTIAEQVALREGGVGFGSGTNVSGVGALNAISGTVTWTGNMDLSNSNASIGVESGATLIVSGVIANQTGSTMRLLKAGAGTLRLTGTQANVYRGDTVVLQGTLELGKTAGVNAIGGNLVIGDNIGGDNAAAVRLLANNQIPHIEYFGAALTTTTMNSSGLLDFNGFTDTIGNLTMVEGSTYSADINLNGGTLVLGGAALTLNGFQGSSGVTPAATISNGTFDLGSYFSGAGGGLVKTFTVNDTQLGNVAADLVISANITGAADIGINKAGGGTLVLSGNNTLAGPVALTAGIVGIGSNNAFGTGIVSLQGSTLRAFGADRTVPTPVSLDATVPVLGDLDITFTAPATLTAGRTIQVMDPNAIVTFAAPVGEGIFGSQAFAKSGRGTLQFTAANTFSGAFTINDDGGTVSLAGNGTLQNVTSFTIGQNGVLKLDNSGTNLTDRLNDVSVINNNAGEVLLVGNPTAASTEVTGTINTGDQLATTISVQNTSAGAQSVALVANALGMGGTRNINFQAIGGTLSATGPNRIVFQNNPGNLIGGTILTGSRVTSTSGLDVATYGNAPEGIAVVPLPAAGYTSDLTNAGLLSNVKITTPGTYTLTNSKLINSLIVGPGVTINGADVLLNTTSGIILFTGSGTSAINVESLNAGNGSISADVGMNATIGSNIIAGSIFKAGPGRVILTGDNTFSGNSVVNQGFLNIQRSSALGSVVGTTTVRQGATLEVEQTTFGAVNIGLETIGLNGVGVSTTGEYADAVGALRNVAGNNSLAGRINLGGNATDLTGATLLNGFPVITNGTTFFNVATGSRFTHTESIVNDVEVIKRGGGTLEFAGAFQNTYNASTRVLEGTLDFNKEPGIPAVINTVFIGSDRTGAPAATLKLSKNEQIRDSGTAGTFIHSSGLLDIGQTEGFGGTLTMVVAANGGAKIAIGSGGTLTTNGDLTVMAAGTGNATGASITGGTVALQYLGIISVASVRTWQVNDGAIGSDLTVNAAIVDGTGLQSMGITKNGFGALEMGGTTANSITGLTTVNEGALLLNKGNGTGGVSALQGTLQVGDNNPQSGFAGSDIVRWLQPNQLADFSAPITVTATGRLELNGKNEVIGNVDAQAALTLQAASSVDLGGGTLGINGNIVSTTSTVATLWTPNAAPRITNGTLDFGAVPRTIDTGNDVNQLPFELEIGANLTGTAGFIQATTTGTVLLSGNNSGLSGEIYRGGGNLAVGSDTAFGAAKVFISGGHLTTYNGPRNLANEFFMSPTTIAFIGGNGYAGSGAIGGGGNNLTFSGPVQIVNITGAQFLPSQAVAGVLEFAGGLGESGNTFSLRKQGPGTIVFSSPVTLSGGIEIGQDPGGFRWYGGTMVVRGQGSILNSGFLIGTGGVLQIDNSQGNLTNRIGDTAAIDLFGGTLALVSGSGVQATESVGLVRGRNTLRGEVHVLTSPAPGSSANWRFTSVGLEGTSNGTTLKFVGRGQAITDTGLSRVAVNALPTGGSAMVDGILPYGVMQGPSGFDFLTITTAPATAPFDNFITSLTSGANFGTSLATATATVNVKLTASETLAAPATANAVLLANGGIIVGGNDLTVDTGLVISAGVGNQITAPNLNVGVNDGLFYVNDKTDLTVSSAIPLGRATLILAKGGLGLLTLSGTNTFNGLVRPTEGTIRAASNNAFGSTVNGATVTFGATIELAGNISIPAETLTLNGNGEANLGAVPLRNFSGTNTWEGNVALQNNRTAIDVPAGQLNIGTASSTGIVSNQGFNKFGSGTLRFAGNASNTFAFTSLVWQGTVELGKTGAGIAAIPIMSDNNEFFVGSYWGANDSANLSFLASDQIGDGFRSRLRIMASGILNLNGFSETIEGRLNTGVNHDVLGLEIGPISSSDVNLGGGTLRIGNNVSENGRIQTRVLAGGYPVPAVISNGTLELTGPLGSAGGPRRILVDDSAGIEDLLISATIADGAGGSTQLSKSNPGRLVLAPSAAGGNTYTGVTSIEGGEVVVRNANSLGTNAAQTTVLAGFSLLVDGVSLSEPLVLNGVGYGGQGVIRNIAGNNTLTGGVTLAGTSTLSVNAGTSLDINAAISESAASGVTKLMGGTLTYSGSAANTYTGTTTVAEGTLVFNKTAGTNAINGPLTIGNDAGSTGNLDVVQLNASNQIPDNTVLIVNSTGVLNIGTNSETLGGGAITMTSAGTQASLITTSGAGVFNLTGNLTASGAGGTFTTKAPGATIAGTLNLQDGARTFTANDANLLAIRELVIDAFIVSGTTPGAGAITTTGAGLVVLSNNNTSYTGSTFINGGGGLVLRNSGALGPITNTLNISVAASLFFTNYGAAATTVTISNPITLNADLTIRGDNNVVLAGPISGQGAANRTLNLTVNAASNLTVSGPINLSNDGTQRTFIVNTNTFNHATNLSGVLRNGSGAVNHAFQKGGTGTLIMSGDSNSGANTDFIGTTTISTGIVRMAHNNAFGNIVAETQQFSVGGGIGSSFTLTYLGATTAPIPFDGAGNPPTTAQVAAAFNLLSPVVRSAPVTVTGTPGNYTIVFSGLAGVDVNAVTVTNLVSASASGVATTVSGGGTSVSAGATLQLIPGLSVPEFISLNGAGLGNLGALRFIDVTPGTSETTTLTNASQTLTAAFIGVDGGGANPDRLIINGYYMSAAGVTTKVGAGDLEFGGTSDNGLSLIMNGATLQAGFDDGFDIRSGTVIFNKVTGSMAYAGGTTTALNVGDGGGPDRLILTGASLDHIGGTQTPVNVNPGAFLTMSGSATTEVLPAAVTINRWLNATGTIDSTATRTFILNNNVTVANFGYTDGATPAGTIAGQLDLAAATRTFTVNDSIILNSAEDLVVSAVMSSATAGTGITRNGFGTMAVTGVNTYQGTTSVNAAEQLDGIFGRVGGTLVARGAGTLGTGALTINEGSTVTLDNSATNVVSRVGDAVAVTMNGSLNLIGNAAGSTEIVGNVTVNVRNNGGAPARITIDSSAGGLTMLQTPALGRGGGATVELVGVGAALGATTNSRIQVTTTNPLVNNVLTWGTVRSPGSLLDLITDTDGTAGSAPYFLGPVTTYSNDINAGGIVRLTGGTHTITANTPAIAALLIEGGATVNSNNFDMLMGTATAGLIYSAGGNNAINLGATGEFTYGAREPLFLVESGSQLTANGLINSTAGLRLERGGTLVLAGDNEQGANGTFTGAIDIGSGTLRASNADALNQASAATVTVRNLASLILDADMSTLTARTLNLSGPGVNNAGALQVTAGSDIVWGNGTSNFAWNQTPGNLTPLLVNVAATGTFNASGTTTNANAPLIKIGGGSMEFSGTTANANASAISVNEGTLILNKTAAVSAVVSALTIEDLGNFDPAGVGTVTYGAAGGTNNIADTISVVVNDQGVLNLAGASDIINALTVNGSRVGSDNLATGAGTLQINGGLNLTGGTLSGNILLNSNLAYNSNSFGPNGQAIINAQLDLNTPTGNAARTFTIADNYAVNDLVINGRIFNGRILKQGAGALALTNATNVLTDFSEVQVLTIPETVSSFTLNFNGVVTSVINSTFTAAAIQTALNTVLGTGTTNVTLTGGGGTPYTLTVTFTGILAGANVANFAAVVTSGSGTITAAVTDGASGFNLNAGSLALNATAALGGGTLNVSATTTVRPIAGAALNLSSRILMNPNLTTIFGGRRDFGGTDALTLSGTEIVVVPGLNLNNNWQIDDPLLNMQVTGVIAGGARNVASTSNPLVKTGFGKLVLSGTSTFVGNVTVSAGILNLQSNGALGAATPALGNLAGQVVSVAGMAAIELEGGVTISDRTLILNVANPPAFATGYLNDFNGALRSRSGSNIWRGTVDMRSFDAGARSIYIGVDAGQLTIDGSIIGTTSASAVLGNSLIKVGNGTLVFDGAAPNQYTGTTAVISGTLVLNKPAGVNAIAGTLVVGDNFGTDIVESRNAEQIVNTALLQVQSSGQLILNGVAAAVANEVQTLTFPALATTGTWNLSVLGTNLVNLPFNITPSALESMISAAIPGSVVRVGGVSALQYTFTFLGPNAGQDVVDTVAIAPQGSFANTTTTQQGGMAITGGETVNTPQLFVGATSSASIDLGGAMLLLNGDVTVTARPGITTSVAAQITGTAASRVSLLPENATVAATRTFTVNDGSGLVELNVIPVIIDKPGTIFTASLTKTGAGRLSLAGDNTYTGTVTISQGALRIQHPNALGDTGFVPGGPTVTVAAGTALEFDIAGTNTIDNELFSVAGAGIVNGSVTALMAAPNLGTGAIRNISGNNRVTVSTIDSVFTMTANTLFAVNGGKLTIDGVITGAFAVIKAGSGDLEMAGNVDNAYSGNTFVSEGKLVLNKSGIARAIGGNTIAGSGELFIGDNLGPDNSDSVEYAATAGTDQINDFRPIHITRNGRLNLNNISDFLTGTFFLDVGSTMSGDVVTGTGVLTMNTNTFYAMSQAGQTATSPAVTLQGFYDGSVTGNRIFTPYEGPANVEMDIQAVLSGAAAVTWTKQGRGTTIFSGNNTYTGTTLVNTDGGTLVINSPATVAASNFTVNPGATLGGNGTINGTVTVAANGSNLTIGGTINPGTPGAAPNNTGILTVANNVSFGNRSELFVDLNGNVPGTSHDQLRITGTGTLTISNAVNNGANLNGRTGAAVIAGTGIKVIDKVSAGGFTGTPTAATPFFANAFSLTGNITLGTRSYAYVYNDNSGLPLGDGNDFVLTAIPSTVVWDGRVDGGAITASNNWTLAANWVGDAVPSPGDAILFNDIGIGNGKNLPFNDFPALSQFGVITFANSSGSYTITGNSITLAHPTLAAVISDNTLNLPVSNSLNVALVTATLAQTITVKDGSTLTLGPVTMVAAAPLTINNGVAGPDATGNIVFGGTVNGAAALTINLAGTATFTGAVGGTTPLTSVTITTADDVTFNSTVATTGNLLQSAGTGTTTLSGGTIGGTLSISNEAVALAGVTTTVTGNTTLNATIGGVTQTAGALITPSLTLTGVGVFSLPQAANDFNTLAANVDGATTIRDVDDLLISGTGIITSNDDVAIQTGTTLGVNAPVNLGTGDLTLTTGAATTQTAAIIGGGLELLGVGPFTLLNAANDIATLAANTTEAISYNDATGFVVGTVTGSGTTGITTTNDNVTLGAGGAVTQLATASILSATLTLQGAGSFNLNSATNDATSLAGNTTGAITYTDANNLALGVITAGVSTVTVNSVAGALTDGNAAANNITAGAFVATSATGVGTVADPLETTLGGLEAAGGSGGVFIANTGSLTIGGVSAVVGVSAAGSISITSTAGIAVGELITTPGNVTLAAGTGGISTPTAGVDVTAADLNATATTGIDLDTDVATVTLTNTGAGNVIIDEVSALVITNLTVANGNAAINAGGALTNGAGSILSVSGNGSFGGSTVNLGTQAGDSLALGSLAFNSPGAVTIDLNSATALGGTSTANSLLLTSTGALTNLAGASVTVTGAATLSAPSISLGSQAGDSINFGSLNFNTPGAANIAVDSNMQLFGVNTAASANLSSTAALTNAAAASITISGLGTFGGATVNLGNQAGDTFNTGNLGFSGTGAINISEDSSITLGGTSNAGSVQLTSPSTIDNAPGANVNITGATVLSATSIALGNQAGDVLSFGPITFTATGGGVLIEENGSLQLAGANTAPGAILLTAIDAASAGQDLTLAAGGSVTSGTSSITLNAGDNATIAGNLTSALATTINVDFGDAESPGVIEATSISGGVLTITPVGVITTPAVGSGGGLFLNGNDDYDTFSLQPQVTTEIRINGNDPTGTDTGDNLALDTSVATGALLNVPGTIAPYIGAGSGSWTFTSAHQQVLFTNIEEQSPPTPFHLTIDNSVSMIGNIVIMRDASQTRVQIRNGSNAGPIVFQGLLTTILSVRVLGSAANDMVTIDDINTLPDFIASVPGVGDNPNLAGTGEIFFDGMGGNDTLVYNLNGPSVAQTYAIGTGSSPGSQAGEILSVGSGISLPSYFQNVELVQRIGTNATPGSSTIEGDTTNNSIAITASGALNRVTATGYVPYEVSNSSIGQLTVNGGAGTDTLELISLGSGAGNPAINLNGGADADTIRVHSTSTHTGPVTLVGGTGSDIFQLFNALNQVDGIVAPIVVDGTDGSLAANNDQLIIDDSGDLTADTVSIGAVNPAMSADYRVEGITSTPGDDVVFRNIDTLSYTGTQGNDLLDTRLVNTLPAHDLSFVTVNGWLGADQFLLYTSDQLGGTSPAPTATASGVNSINLNGDAPGNPNPTDGNDIFGETAPGLVGTGSGNAGLAIPSTLRWIRPSVSTAITINGGRPTGPVAPTGDTIGDVLNLDLSFLPANAPLILGTVSGIVATTGAQLLSYSEIEDFNLALNNKLINVQMGDLLVLGTTGADLIQFSKNPVPGALDQSRIRLNTLVQDITTTGKTLVYAGASNDYVTMSNVEYPGEIYGEDGDDYIAGGVANDFLVGGLGNDQINASRGDNIVWGDDATGLIAGVLPQDSVVGGNDILSSLEGNDVFYGGGGNDQVSPGAGDDYIYGGAGNDLLDGAQGDDRIYGGDGDDVISGSGGNDLLVGGAGSDQLMGRDGNDVLIGGDGSDSLVGDGGDDLIISGLLFNEASSWVGVATTSTFDPSSYSRLTDNDAALMLLLSQWGSLHDKSSLGSVTSDGDPDIVVNGTGNDDLTFATT
ncbi:autotransporter-associated beta strand repeat-containing protein [Anatilimnocola floriformis]|uniref:autotransporter-associated beta strand repeat-containing protein n=1 Tax=Anatilimnocola floriformis TaxID=2948575 RepID=UPI0020C55365|nr:autotransporter-associated beta strand repeat-containing protein [Anatilimnocola floriformis]